MPNMVAIRWLALAACAGCTIPHQAGSIDGADLDAIGAEATVEAAPNDARDQFDVPIPFDALDVSDVSDVSDASDAADAESGDAPDVGDVVDVRDTGLCPANTMRCPTGCVSTSDPRNCGTCGHDCTALANVDANLVQCTSGRCDLTSACVVGHANCSGNPNDGCNVNVTTPMQCGACGAMCPAGTPMCGLMAGAYVCMSGCSPNETLCGTTCSDLNTDTLHCGHCNGHVCPVPMHGAATCSGGTCGFTCDTGFHSCNGACVDNTLPAHCGTLCSACSAPPSGTATCDGTNCGFSCNGATHPCGGACVDNTSPATCGTSCTACMPPANATATCDGTQCGFTCTTGHVRSGASCVPTGDVCPGMPLTVALGNPAPVTSSTVGLNDDYQGSCNSARQPDAVWQLNVAGIPNGEQAVLHTRYMPTGYTGVAYVRGMCNVASTETDCQVGTAPGAAIDSHALVGNGSVFAILDGTDGAGAYAANFSISLCGNRVLDPSETCDDGNFTNTDGCESTCALTDPAALDQCAGSVLQLSPGLQVYSGSTSGAASNFTPVCAAHTAQPARLYQVHSTLGGTLRIDVVPSATYDAVLMFFRGAACATATQTCQDSMLAGGTETLSGLSIAPNETVWVGVTGLLGSGTYTLRLTLN